MIDSRCGLHCIGCEYKATCGCGGCIETNGHEKYVQFSKKLLRSFFDELFLPRESQTSEMLF